MASFDRYISRRDWRTSTIAHNEIASIMTHTPISDKDRKKMMESKEKLKDEDIVDLGSDEEKYRPGHSQKNLPKTLYILIIYKGVISTEFVFCHDFDTSARVDILARWS